MKMTYKNVKTDIYKSRRVFFLKLRKKVPIFIGIICFVVFLFNVQIVRLNRLKVQYFFKCIFIIGKIGYL